jgi:xylan 1,4-beta-xylosidase
LLLRHYIMDRAHSNASALWEEMGSPPNPAPEQYAQLKAAGQLRLMGSPSWIGSTSGKVELQFSLPRQALSLVELRW